MKLESVLAAAEIGVALLGCGAKDDAPDASEAQGVITTVGEAARDKITAAEKVAAQMREAAEARAKAVEAELDR